MRLLLIIVAFLVALSASDCFYIINYDKNGLLVQFGEVVNDDPLRPGLGIKKPFIQRVALVESRIIDLPSDAREVIAADQKRLIVNYYTKYRIIDPALFYRTTRHESVLESRLKPIVESQMREEIGKVHLLSLLNEQRNSVMEKIRLGADSLARESLGVAILDVRIKRTDLPEENSEAVFRRMQTEREKEAKEIRAQGFEIAQKIKSMADKEESFIISEAKKDSQILIGEGEAEAAKILSDAFSIDADFFDFYKTLGLYKEAIAGKKSTFVFSDKDGLLRLFYNGNKL